MGVATTKREHSPESLRAIRHQVQGVIDLLDAAVRSMEKGGIERVLAERQVGMENALQQITSWAADLHSAIALEMTRIGALEAEEYVPPQDATWRKWQSAITQFAQRLSQDAEDLEATSLAGLLFPAVHAKTESRLKRLNAPLYQNARRMAEVYAALREELDGLGVLDPQGRPKSAPGRRSARRKKKTPRK